MDIKNIYKPGSEKFTIIDIDGEWTVKKITILSANVEIFSNGITVRYDFMVDQRGRSSTHQFVFDSELIANRFKSLLDGEFMPGYDITTRHGVRSIRSVFRSNIDYKPPVFLYSYMEDREEYITATEALLLERSPAMPTIEN